MSYEATELYVYTPCSVAILECYECGERLFIGNSDNVGLDLLNEMAEAHKAECQKGAANG